MVRHFPWRNSKKKGIALNQAFGAVLALVLISVLVIVAIFLFVTLGGTFTAGTAADGPTKMFNSGLVGSGGSTKWTPDRVGEYPYFCMVHPWMEGTIIVENTSTETNSTCGAGTVFDDASNSCVLSSIPDETDNLEIEEQSLEFNIRKKIYNNK